MNSQPQQAYNSKHSLQQRPKKKPGLVIKTSDGACVVVCVHEREWTQEKSCMQRKLSSLHQISLIDLGHTPDILDLRDVYLSGVGKLCRS